MPSFAPTIVFIGGGPRSAGILERLAANKPGLFDGPLSIHVVEPYEPVPGGSGAMTRAGTPAQLDCGGRHDVHRRFRGLRWSLGGRSGSRSMGGRRAGRFHRDIPQLEPHLLEQLRALTPGSFPSRQLQSRYLEWFFRRAVAALGRTSR
ncbi:hypothetical protein GCM10017710_49120 [Arthrobacter ramosus]